MKALAVPYGAYNERVKEVCRKAGYDALFTVNGMKIGYGTPLNEMGRYMIEANKPNVFSEAIVFEGTKSGSEPSVVVIKSLRSDPADGAVLRFPPPVLRVELGNFGVIDPGSVSMRLSGAGTVPALYDPQSKTIAYQPVKPLGADKYTVIVTATSQGKRMETRWSFTIEPQQARQIPTTVAAHQR